MAGLYEYPNTDGNLTASEISDFLRTLGFTSVQARSLPEAKHIFSHKEWHMTGWEILADEWEEFESGVPKEHELFLASASDLKNIYSIPSAFAKYTSQIRTDFLD